MVIKTTSNVLKSPKIMESLGELFLRRGSIKEFCVAVGLTVGCDHAM